MCHFLVLTIYILLQKKVSVPKNFEGSGNRNEQSEVGSDQKSLESQQNEETEPKKAFSTKLENEIDDPIKYNEAKRKRLGAPIQESFLHPKLIKTNKIIFHNTKTASKSNPNSTALKKKEVQHKFQFL